MKRLFSLLLVLCLTLSFTSALAATITITQQPETQTIKAGGTVSFKVKAKNANGAAVTWYFTNPATGEVITGRKLQSAVKGLKVSNPNGLNIILKKVPASMHGWSAYAHIGPKNSGVDTDTVQILIEGNEPAATATSTDVQPAEATATDVQPTEATATDVQPEKATATDVQPEPQQEEAPVVTPEPTIIIQEVYITPDPAEPVVTPEPTVIIQEVYVTPEPTPDPYPIIITGTNLELYMLDRSGDIVGEASEELTFESGDANFYVKLPEGSDATIKYVLIDGIRFTPEGAVTGMSIRGWDHSASVSIKTNKKGGANTVGVATMTEPEQPVDESTLVNVTCTNCRFTGWKNSFAESGQVPAGTTITVVASGGVVSRGYSINNEGASHKNEASFQLTVDADTTITMESQARATQEAEAAEAAGELEEADDSEE